MGQEKSKQISTEEYINGHINRVQKWIGKFSTILFVRGINHDKSKLCEPEFSMWKKMDEEPRYPYGTPEYKEKLNRYKILFDQLKLRIGIKKWKILFVMICHNLFLCIY